MRQDIREYITDLMTTIARQRDAFRLLHPGFGEIDLAILAEITVDGSPVFGSLTVMESTADQQNVDVRNEQRQAEMCRRYLRTAQVDKTTAPTERSVNTMSSTFYRSNDGKAQ